MARTFPQEAIIRSLDIQTDDSFGISVAIDGDTAIVGAGDEDGGPGDPLYAAGAAYVFERVNGVWVQVAKLTASDAQDIDYFGGSVAISGNTAVVGASGEDGGKGDPTSASGAAYVFGRNVGGADTWGEVAKLTASDAQADDQFGLSVGISGDTAVVGTAFEDGGTGDPTSASGAAYVFGRDEGGTDNWGEVAKLVASDAEAGDGFGVSVGISGNTAIVGAHFEDGGAGDPIPGAGAAYVFEFVQGFGWLQIEKLSASDAQTDDRFGVSVAISGDTGIVGAHFEDGGGGDPLVSAGAAYLFERDEGGGNNWGEVMKITASDAQAGDIFGKSVAISGDLAVVAANEEAGGLGDPIDGAGAAYVFGRNEGGADNWGELAKLTASDAQENDKLGKSVAISGGSVVVGTRDEDGGFGDPLPASGATYIYRESFLGIFIAGVPKPGRLGS